MIEEYLKAHKAGEKEYKAKLAKGEYPFVPALDDILPNSEAMPRQALGLMEIPVELIKGTKTQARQNAFTPGFMPLLEGDTEFADKWSSLYMAQIDEGFNSPIKVYEYLHRFYVQEGNKRVSVSRFLGMPTIMADVTRIVPDRKVMDENPAYAEFLEFFRVAPIYDIVCTQRGSYNEIAELLGRPLKSSIAAGEDDGRPEADAADERWPEDMVKSLRSSYWRFSETVHALQDKIPEMPLGDAFVIYLRIYFRDALSVQSGGELDKRLLRIRKELMTEYNRDRISLVESSDEALNAGGVLAKTGGLITRKSGKAVQDSILGKVIPVHSYSAKHPLKVAFIYDRDPKDSDWLYNHESGRLRMEKAYGGIVETAKYVTEGDAGFATFEDAAEAAAKWGAEAVFTPSVRQMNDALRAAIRYEDIKFLNCSINLAHQAVRTYYAKLYEAKFLAGVIAGTYSSADGSHMIGYLSDYPIYGTIAAINAFAIGAAMTDPQVKIYLDWQAREDEHWWSSMINRGIHVISAIDSAHNKDGTNAYGLCYVEKVAKGEGTDLEGTSRITNLAVPLLKWGKLYEIIIRTIIEGTYHAKHVDRKNQATNYWWGMTSGVVDIEISEEVPAQTRRLAEVLRADIIDGRFNPFDGELTSQSGIVRSNDDPLLNSMDVITMDWLNENIIGSIPGPKELKDGPRQTVSMSGVKKS